MGKGSERSGYSFYEYFKWMEAVCDWLFVVEGYGCQSN